MVTAINPAYGISVGLIVFVICILLVRSAWSAIDHSQRLHKYDADGCMVDDNGQRYGNTCNEKVSTLYIYSLGTFVAFIFAAVAGSSIHRLIFTIANPIEGAQMYVANSLNRFY